MRRLVLTICVALLSVCTSFPQSYGLKFSSHETVPEKRTALELSPDDSLYFSNDVRLDFDLNFVRGYQVYFGYVLRIINGQQNIDIIYDQHTAVFRIIFNQSFSGLSFSFDSAQVYNNWNSISILIEPGKQKLQLSVNNKPVGSANITLKTKGYKFLWGANDIERYQTRDIPSMRIKDIRLFDGGSLKYNWPLNEIAGNTSLDKIHKTQAVIKNPVWIKPSHQNWNLVTSFTVQGNAVASFDKKNEILYIAGSDSVLAYNVKNIITSWKKTPVNKTNIVIGSQAVYDTFTNKLYDVLIDSQRAISYQPGAASWSGGFRDTALTEYWQANKFISALDTSIYIIGGYGQLKYKNTLQRYSIPGKTWEIIKPGGDFFSPRYLSALGINETGDTAFIIGGYGSKTGDQMLDPGNYSDMYAFDVRSKTFKKLFNLDSLYAKYTFANSLVIDSKKQEYYGLIFPNDSFNSNLQLIQGSLKSPSVKLFDSKIPYSFYDVQSFADLFYSPQAGKLIAITFFYTNFDLPQKFTTVKIYSIDFPPENISGAATTPYGAGSKYILIGAAALVLVVLAFFFLRKRKLKEESNVIIPGQIPQPQVIELTPVIQNTETQEPLPVIENIIYPQEEKKIHRSTIFLFGQFQVFDNEGKDITGLFTPLTKELFLLIVTNTIRNGRGITADGPEFQVINK